MHTLIYEERLNDWEMMVLHHVATNVLLVTSNYGSCYRYGAVVLIIHDIPDIAVCLVRTLVSLEGYTYSMLFLGYFPLLITWGYFRLLYLPWVIYGIIFYCTYPPHLSDMNEYLKTQAFFLSSLFVMHIIWYKIFIEMGLKYVYTGKANDKIGDIEASVRGHAKKAASPKSPI